MISDVDLPSKSIADDQVYLFFCPLLYGDFGRKVVFLVELFREGKGKMS